MKKDLSLFRGKHILLQHAFLGYDTTSWLFGIGKGTVLKKFKVNSALQQAADVDDETSSTPAVIESAEEKGMDDSLNSLLLWKDGKKL